MDLFGKDDTSSSGDSANDEEEEEEEEKPQVNFDLLPQSKSRFEFIFGRKTLGDHLRRRA